MYQRFRAYLEIAFRGLSPTQESEEYKAELLGTLMDRAEAMKNDGETDEDVIYESCIDQLGDFKANFANFKSLPNVKEVVKRTLSIAGIAAIYMLLLVAIFLTVSFTVGPWSKTWLILVCGALVGIIAGLIILCILSAQRKYIATMRFLIAVVLTLGIVVTYLMYSVLSANVWGISWLLFLFLPIILSGVDLVVCLVMNVRKLTLPVIVFIMITSALLYVILGVTHNMPWHPGWLMPTIGAIVDLILIILSAKLKIFTRKKK